MLTDDELLGKPWGERTPEERAADPRPDLATDSDLWARLLAMAYDHDGDLPGGLFGALHGLRSLGAGLVVNGGRAKLIAGEMTRAEYEGDRTTYLLQHKAPLVELLRRLDVVCHAMAEDEQRRAA